jgi:DNA-binding transcriptional ArsR family regulator
MELDFKSVKALASPTRIEILRRSMEQEATPTSLADELDRSKSTISSHLEKLTEADLLEKDSEEGRRRVVYHPTSKAEAIASGKKKKVRFSLASSGVSGLAGAGLVGYSFLNSMTNSGGDSEALQAQEMGAQAMDKAETAAESGMLPEEVFLFAGIGFLTIALGSLAYGLVMNRIGE